MLGFFCLVLFLEKLLNIFLKQYICLCQSFNTKPPTFLSLLTTDSRHFLNYMIQIIEAISSEVTTVRIVGQDKINSF